MRALVLAPQPFFSPRGTPISVYYRTLVAAELGVQIDLLTYGQGQDVEIPGVNVIRTPSLRWFGKVKVGPSVLKFFLDALLFIQSINLLVRNRYDFVHAHEEAAFLCLLLKPVFGFRWVYDMHSSLPRQLTSFQFTTSPLLIRLFEKLEAWALTEADGVVTICEDLHQYANSILSDPGKNLLIENSLVDPIQLAESEVPHVEIAASVSAVLPDDINLIVYAGTLEAYQGIGLVLEAIALVKDVRTDILLVIAGGNPEQINELQRQAAKLEIADYCQFLGIVPRTEVMSCYKRATVLLSARLTGTNVPLKIYEQLASGKPIVATDVYAHTQVLSNKVAFLAEPNPRALANAMIRALDDTSEREKRVRAALELHTRRFTRDAYVANMRKLMDLVT